MAHERTGLLLAGGVGLGGGFVASRIGWKHTHKYLAEHSYTDPMAALDEGRRAWDTDVLMGDLMLPVSGLFVIAGIVCILIASKIKR